MTDYILTRIRPFDPRRKYPATRLTPEGGSLEAAIGDLLASHAPRLPGTEFHISFFEDEEGGGAIVNVHSDTRTCLWSYMLRPDA